MAKLIELRDVYKIYGEGLESEVRALDGVSLDIEKGEFVAVVGQSGSGKSTMMNVLGCLDIPTRGTYLLDGTDVQDLSDGQLSHIRNQQIGFIFQQYNLIQTLTVQENVELPLIYRGIDPIDRKELALEEQLELSLPEDVDVSELEYLLLWDGELGTQKPENTGGTVMELVKMGSITKEEAAMHPKRNVITRAIGIRDTVETDTVIHPVQKGDIVLLCTDGLSGMLKDEEMAKILSKRIALDKKAAILVEEANRQGGHDNISLILVEI